MSCTSQLVTSFRLVQHFLHPPWRLNGYGILLPSKKSWVWFLSAAATFQWKRNAKMLLCIDLGFYFLEIEKDKVWNKLSHKNIWSDKSPMVIKINPEPPAPVSPCLFFIIGNPMTRPYDFWNFFRLHLDLEGSLLLPSSKQNASVAFSPIATLTHVQCAFS